jgi:transposase
LKSAGLKAVVKKKRPALISRHKKARLEFAEQHLYWTVDDWKQVVWSDEMKINHIGSDGLKWVWKKPGEGLSDRLVSGTRKFGGGSLMMWGCMFWEGVGYATRIEGRMDGQLYESILNDELVQSVQWYKRDLKKIIFQHDNDPKHTSKIACSWLRNHKVSMLQWPPQSPDLNPIEHLWNHLKRKLAAYETEPAGMLELWDRVEKEWEAIEPETCQRLIESMPERVAAVKKAQGGYTKY